ncbi:MAG TPA: hypothetical protein VEH01_03590 [Nitrososphaerales archaeon]|nr:hypothetical protein [Nitrososphaerales archaeon]
MNTGYPVAILGVLGVILGASLYAADWHRTIGLGGIGLGIVLILAGVYMARSTKPAAAPQAAQAPK